MMFIPEPIIAKLLTSVHTIVYQLNYHSFWLARLEEKDVDIVAQVQEAFKHFVQTGQIWALLIGIVAGYMFRSFTSF